MLDEPPYTETASAVVTRLCLMDGKVVAYINLPALEALLWSFWYLAAKSSKGEDISLSNEGNLPDIPDCSPLNYCEITMVGEGPVMGRLHNPMAEFLHREPRADVFANRLQAERGYQSLQRLGTLEATGRVEQVELFGRLVFRLLPADTKEN